MILAQLAGYSLVHLLVMVVVIAACVGIVLIALRQFGVAIPPFMVQIFWICLCAVIAIFAIKFVAGM
jgi:hypothetical protein